MVDTVDVTDRISVYRRGVFISVPIQVLRDYLVGNVYPFAPNALDLPSFPMHVGLLDTDRIAIGPQRQPYRLERIKGFYNGTDAATPLDSIQLASFPARPVLTGAEQVQVRQGSGRLGVALLPLITGTQGGLAPVNTVLSTFVGGPQVAVPTVASTGTWINGVTSYAYKFRVAGTIVQNSASNLYLPISADATKALTYTVLATNAVGTMESAPVVVGNVAAAAATINITQIAADGYQAQYNALPPTFTPDTSPEIVPVTRKVWTSALAYTHATTGAGGPTTAIENFIINRRMRDVFPNHANDVGVAGTTFSPPYAVAMSDFIYGGVNADVITGITNNSTRTSPKPYGRWSSPDGQTVGNSIEVRFQMVHRNGRNKSWISGAVLRATDGSTTVYSPVINTLQISSMPGDVLGVEEYIGTIDITSLSQGKIKVDVAGYAWVGGTANIFDSAALLAAGGTKREFTSRYYRKDNNNTGLSKDRFNNPPLAYINATTGTATGSWSTNAVTALADPFDTVANAVAGIYTAGAKGANVTGGIADACRIRLPVGNTPLVHTNASRPQTLSCLTFEPAPGVARGAAVLTVAAAWAPRIGLGSIDTDVGEGLVAFTGGMSIQRTANVVMFNGFGATPLRVYFMDVASMDCGSFAGGIVNTGAMNIYGMVATNVSASAQFGGILSTNQMRCARSLSADLAFTSINLWHLTGCVLTRPGGGAIEDPLKGCFIYGNKCINPVNSGTVFGLGTVNANETMSEICCWNNLLETTHTVTSTPGSRFSTDTAQHGNTYHMIYGCNTFTGVGGAGRDNSQYDNTPTEYRTHELYTFVGFISPQINRKNDIFVGTGSPTDAPFHTGALNVAHGTACEGLFSLWPTNSPTSEAQTYPGPNSIIGTSTTVLNDPKFVDYRGSSGTPAGPVQGAGGGVGGGDYRLALTSPCRNKVKTARNAFTLDGIARNATNDHIGAFSAV